MDSNIIELKSKLEKVIDILDNYPPDNVPENIKVRRVALGNFKRDIETIRTLVTGKIKVVGFMEELITLFNDYFHYFDTGYKSTYSIDVLPQMLRDKITLAIDKLNKV